MFGKIRKAYNALRLLSKAEGAWKRGLKQGADEMPPKAGLNVGWVTNVGAAVVAVAAVLSLIGRLMQGDGSFMELLPTLVEHIGYAVAIIGGRRAVAKLTNGNGF